MQLSYKWKVVLVVIAGTFMMILDMTIVNVALPHIMAVFNDTIDRAQFVVSAYLMATAISAPAAAFLSARFGIKRIYLASQVSFLLGSVFCGLAWNTNSLILFRIVQGLSGGLLMPLAMTFLFTNVPKEEQGTAMGIFGIPMLLAPAIGPTLGGYLVEYWDWRMCFYVNVPVVIVAFLLGLAWIVDTPRRVDLPLDWKGFLLAAIGFSTILFGLSYAPNWGWGDTRIVSLFGIGIISLAGWVMVELREKIPMLDLRIFTYRGYSLGTGVNFVVTLGLFSSVFLLPLFLQNVKGLGAFEAGLLLVPQALGAMIGTPIGGRLYDRVGARLPVIAGLLLTGLFTLKLQTLDVTTSDADLRLILVLRGMGMGLSMMPIMTFALAEVPTKLISQASSLTNVSRTVFASLGTAMFASLLDSFQKTNLASMVQTVTPDSVYTVRVLSTIQVGLQQSGMSLEAARQLAVTLLYQLTALRASVMAFDSAFVFSAIILLVGIIPALFMYHHKNRKREPGTNNIPLD